MIACFHQLLKTRFGKAKILQEHLSLVLIQFRNLLLNLSTNYEDFTILLCRKLSYFLNISIICSIICKILFSNIGSINYRLLSKQIIGSHPCFLILILKLHCNGHLSVFQPFLNLLKEVKLLSSFLIHACCFGNFGDSSLQNLKIRKNQFQINGLNITDRINASVYMNNICIFKTTYYMYNRIYFTDICKELVSKSFALGCSLYKSGNVNKFNYRRSYLLGMIKVSKQSQSLIRHSNNAYIRVNGTERIVGRFCTCLGQRIKKCTFSYVW